MKIKNRILMNYVLIFVITTLIAVMSFYILGFLSGLLENKLMKNLYPAASLMDDDLTEIEYTEVVENHGGIQVVDKDYRIIFSEGLDLFPKEQLTAGEFTKFLTQSQSVNRKYSYDIAYNEGEQYWLIVTFPVSLRFDFSVTYNDFYTSNDSKSVYVIIGIALFLYFMLLFVSTVIYSRMTASSFTKPLKLLQEASKKLSSGDYSSRVNLKLNNEFGELENSFNIMAERVEKEIELRRQSENLRQQLTLDIAHDLKNPLAVVMGYAEYCLNNPSKIDEKYLKLMYQNSSKANLLISGLFELSRLENSQFVLNMKRTDVVEYLRVKVAEYIEITDSQEFLLDYNLPDYEIYAKIDSKEMDRVIDNLVNNAIRYNNKGTTISIEVIDHENTLDIVVSDNGRGISESLSEKIFLPFFREDEARNSETGGSGLGLAIAEKIVRMHSGEINLLTGIGEGCKFTIKLPKI